MERNNKHMTENSRNCAFVYVYTYIHKSKQIMLQIGMYFIPIARAKLQLQYFIRFHVNSSNMLIKQFDTDAA
jgi:hypothetical protein